MLNLAYTHMHTHTHSKQTHTNAYRFLTDKGIDHLRDYLGLPQDVVPATLKKSQR